MDADSLFDKFAFDQPKRWKLVNSRGSSYIYNAHLVRSANAFELFSKIKKNNVPSYTQWFEYATAKNGKSGRAALFSIYGVNSSLTLPSYEPPIATVLFKPKIAVFQIFSDKIIPSVITNIESIVPGIEHWFEDNLIDFDKDKREFKSKKDVFAEIELAEIGKVTLRVDFEIERQQGKFEARNEPKIRMDFIKSYTYEQSIRHFKIIEEFFNFIFSAQTNQAYFLNRFDRPKNSFYGLRRIVSVPDADKQEKVMRNHYDILFKWSDVSEPQTIVANWFNSYGKIEKSISELKLIKNNPTMSESSKFISLITALEYTHRYHIKPPRQETIDKHIHRLTLIKAQLKDSSDRKLINRLKRAYEPSLEDRLRDIRKIANKLGLPAIQDKDFNRIALTRNNQIHSLMKPFPEVLHDNELYDVNKYLAQWIKLLILIMIGLSTTEIQTIVQQSTQFKSFYHD